MDIVMSIREENNAVGEEQSNMGGAGWTGYPTNETVLHL